MATSLTHSAQPKQRIKSNSTENMENSHHGSGHSLVSDHLGVTSNSNSSSSHSSSVGLNSKDDHHYHSSNLVFIIAALGIYASFVPYGVVQEWVYGHRGPDGAKFTFTLTLLLLQAASNIVMSFAATNVARDNWHSFPLRQCWLPGITFISAMLFSNEALRFVSYPTQVLGKSCKMVPVLLGNVLIYRRKHSWFEYIQVGLVTLGIVLFQMKEQSSSKADSLYGQGLLLMSLLMDGLTGPKQDSIVRSKGCTSYQLMLGCNIWAFVYVCIALATFGEGLEGLTSIASDPTLFHYVTLFAFCGALGQLCIYFVLRNFGALRLTFATTTRKFFTILCSVFIFNHVLAIRQWLGVLLVFGGLSCDIWRKLHKAA